MTANAGPATEADEPHTIRGLRYIFPVLTLTSFHSPLSPGHITESPLNDRHFAEGAA
jgi:hypothetical protein